MRFQYERKTEVKDDSQVFWTQVTSCHYRKNSGSLVEEEEDFGHSHGSEDNSL